MRISPLPLAHSTTSPHRIQAICSLLLCMVPQLPAYSRYLLTTTLKQTYYDWTTFFFFLWQLKQNWTSRGYRRPLPAAAFREPGSQGHCVSGKSGLRDQACQGTNGGDGGTKQPQTTPNPLNQANKKSLKNLQRNLHKGISEVCSPWANVRDRQNEEQCFPGSDVVLFRLWKKLLFF